MKIYRLMAGLLLFNMAAWPIGCACNERIMILNQTKLEQRCQIALPWPGYEAAAGRPCQFEVVLAPQQSWDSRSGAKDNADLALRMPNGPALLRVRSAIEEWVTFEIDVAYEGTIDVVLKDRVGNRLQCLAGPLGGPLELRKPSEINWFD